MKKKIWIDMINPSHPLFFRPMIEELKKTNSITMTLRNRGETVKLADQFGIRGRVFGKDFEDPVKKIISLGKRTFTMSFSLKNFDYAISLENPMSVAISKLRRKKSILFLDNDLKYKIRNNLFQSFESKIKLYATTIIIPQACEQTFDKFNKDGKFKIYDGYKEDFYIADYQPNKRILERVPFKEYVLVRGEASSSFYVTKKQTILPKLFDSLTKENINIIFLARDNSDFRYSSKANISLLEQPLNGLDLIYHSNATLTGSGTMSREAACMGIPAVSFFPNDDLLSVDSQLIDEGKILHSRDPKEIVEYVLENFKKKKLIDFQRSKNVRKEILDIMYKCIS